MKNLSKLSPAETVLILEGSDASHKDLLKYTFMDLLLKKVLKTTKKNYRPSKNDPLQVVTYISAGVNFNNYQPLLHEFAFTSPFQKSKTLHAVFRNMVRMAYENSKNKTNYQNQILQFGQLQAYYKKNIFQAIFGGFSLNDEGLELRKALRIEMLLLEKQLPGLIYSDKQKAFEILKIVKGNIFLLKNINFKMLGEFDKELVKEMDRRYEGGESGCSGCYTWSSFDHHSHSFDNSCSNDSGCSGGGCSECSGCGGCGGD